MDSPSATRPLSITAKSPQGETGPKRTDWLQVLAAYTRQWHRLDGTWRPNDLASIIQPGAFANERGVELTAPSDSYTTPINEATRDHLVRLAATLTTFWGISVAGTYSFQSGHWSGPVLQQLSAADPAFGTQTIRLSNGNIVTNPLSTLTRFAFPARAEGQFKLDGVHVVNVRFARTWSRPIVVNDDRRPMAPAAAPNHLLPTVAVNSAGVVGVAWLDRRDAPDNLGWSVRFRASLDGGETFQPSVTVSEAAARFDGREHWPTFAATRGGGTPYLAGGLLNVRLTGSRHLYSPGDFAGLAASIDGTFFPYWIDNRTGWHQVWTAPITVRGSAIRHGSTDLASLDDLTMSTALERVQSDYDASTQTATVVVRLTNTSQQTIVGPFKIRLISLSSDLAIAETLGASNGLTGAGTVWNVLSDVGQLEPDAASQPITLTFRLRDVRPLIQGETTKLLLVEFSARVFGRLSK